MKPTESSSPSAHTDYDVIVVGGAFSGASSALLLKRWMPSCRVLIVERREEFDRKVGEATVEMSGMFLQRVLRMYDYLAREQLPKHGLRYWFSDGPDATLENMSEVGPYSISSLPSFQLDRAKLDEAILERAVDAGAELLRPSRVEEIELGWPQSRVSLRDEEGRSSTASCRWVVDASGRHNLIARKLGILKRTETHPTAAAWGRWSGVRDLDGAELMGSDPAAPRMPQLATARRLATNHFCGYGYWAWAIPLVGGETSIGVVYDKRLFQWKIEGTPREQYLHFVRNEPGLRELVEGAQLDEKDFRGFSHLPYCSERYMDRGWSLVGDAAAFIDPYYSPGLDHASMSVYATSRLIQRDLQGALPGGELECAVAGHNDRFLRSYRRWLDALYHDKYEIMGDAELTGASFLVDTAMYYMGVVSYAATEVEQFNNPILGLPGLRSKMAYRFLSTFRKRMVALARFRRASGCYGRRNRDWKLYPSRFGIGAASGAILLGGLKIWLGAELHALGHRLRHGSTKTSAPTMGPQPTPERGMDAG